MKRKTLFQAFEWYLQSEDALWQKIAESSSLYEKLGITTVWLPPAYKGYRGSEDSGYGVYDMYDLGEFDQKGSIATKYGTKEAYLNVIETLKQYNIEVMVDIVLNHRIGADGTEVVRATEVNPSNRLENWEVREIEAWTQFNFENRNNAYSSFTWNKNHFKGVDFDARENKSGIYLFEGKHWDNDVDEENANYDYLMGADVDFENEDVKREIIDWIHWYRKTTAFNSVRLDALKHIHFPFFKEALKALRHEDEALVAIGEYWSADLRALHNYLMDVDFSMSLFDVPLHHAFEHASNEYERFDLRTIFGGTLVANNPNYAITFVDNHDTQPGQSLQSSVSAWFKPHAYALILLRDEGYPCVFYGDLYGNQEHGLEKITMLPLLMQLRQNHLYGTCYNYFDDPNRVAWAYTGDDEGEGCVVLLNNWEASEKKIFVGKRNASMVYIDCVDRSKKVHIDENGIGVFPVYDKSVNIYVREETPQYESLL